MINIKINKKKTHGVLQVDVCVNRNKVLHYPHVAVLAARVQARLSALNPRKDDIQNRLFQRGPPQIPKRLPNKTFFFPENKQILTNIANNNFIKVTCIL